MSHTYTGWVPQVAGERAAGQPLDTTFWNKWSDRYHALRQRDLPSWHYAETNTFVGGGWETLSEQTEIFIPPYAVGINFRCRVSVIGTYSDPIIGTPVGGIAHSRFLIGGTDASAMATTSYGCRIGNTGPPDFDPVCIGICSGCDADQGGLGTDGVNKDHLFTVPEAMKGTVQTLDVQFQRGHTATISATYNTVGSPRRLIRPWRILEAA